MLSQETKLRLSHAVTDAGIADEIEKRLITATPALPADSQVILDSLDLRASESIENRLASGLAGDRQGAAGREIAEKLAAIVAVLAAHADGEEVAAVAASFSGQVAGMTTDVEISADVAGSAGNITLIADSVTDIDGLILAWNTGNPGNEVSLVSGDGSQVPTAGITLSGGSDASDANTAAAQSALGSSQLSAETKLCLAHALGSQGAADEIQSALAAAVGFAAAVTP
jgi:hypothetical protein